MLRPCVVVKTRFFFGNNFRATTGNPNVAIVSFSLLLADVRLKGNACKKRKREGYLLALNWQQRRLGQHEKKKWEETLQKY